jgi:hypothetical protein
MKVNRVRLAPAVFGALAALIFSSVRADTINQNGRISRVTYFANTVLIMLDVEPSENCAATPFGWMMVPPSNTAMIVFVSGL